jgi:hypothetical protein
VNGGGMPREGPVAVVVFGPGNPVKIPGREVNAVTSTILFSP